MGAPYARYYRQEWFLQIILVLFLTNLINLYRKAVVILPLNQYGSIKLNTNNTTNNNRRLVTLAP